MVEDGLSYRETKRIVQYPLIRIGMIIRKDLEISAQNFGMG